jgi:hypothetical protein
LCAPLNQSCLTAGNGCESGADCCSGLCDDTKHCSLAASFCIQPGDVCGHDGDCCTGNCTIADGQKVGICAAPPKGPAYCDKVDGMLCNGCGDCCSRLCAPGPSGVNICQPASGCHVTGDLCKTDLDCCGGDPNSGLPGAGNGKCLLDASGKIGLCTNPTNGGGGGACNPEGNVCHYLADAGYACTSSSARADCCGDVNPKWKMCQLDPLGVPRCMGAGECKKAGDSCALAADCCDGSPCVPDAAGALHCFDPGGGQACVPGGGSCTINADCCPGGLCHRPAGSIVGTCTAIPYDGGSGGSGGSSGSGSGGTAGSPSYSGCAEYGQLCQANGDCCNDVPCTDGTCAFPVVK